LAAGSYITETLVSSIRRRAMLPATDDGTSFPRDSDIIALWNEEMSAFGVPLVLKARQGHFLTYTDTALVANQAGYTVPSRAVGDVVSTLQLVDSSGSLQGNLIQADPEIATAWPYGTANTGQPTQYFFRGNQIVLVPTPSSTGLYLRVNYPQRPNQLVPTTSVLPITSFPAGAAAGHYRLGFTATAPTTFTTSVTYEAVSVNPGFEVTTLGTISAITGAYMDFVGTQPANIAVGDSICLTDTANVPTNIPADLLPLFCQWVAIKYIELKGDSAQLERAENTFDMSMKRALEFLGKRDQLAHHKISKRNSFGPSSVNPGVGGGIVFGGAMSGDGITSLSGDVSASGPSGASVATVLLVGGSSAANVHAAELLANAATSSNTASTIVKRDGSGNFSAGTITANLTGNVTGNVTGSAGSFTGSLVGDVTGTQGATVVSTVAGSSAANVHAAELLANAATNANTASTIVKRDGSGNFSAGTISAALTGNVTGNVSGSAASFTGSLVGDVTGTQGATVVSTVAGSSAANVHAAELLANAATSANTVSTIVKRDSSGDVALRNLAATGTVTGSNLSGTNTGDVTLGSFGAAPDAKGATISGQVLTLQPADATHPGLVTTGTQTIAGAKTFNNGITLASSQTVTWGDGSTTAKRPVEIGTYSSLATTKADLFIATDAPVAQWVNTTGSTYAPLVMGQVVGVKPKAASNLSTVFQRGSPTAVPALTDRNGALHFAWAADGQSALNLSGTVESLSSSTAHVEAAIAFNGIVAGLVAGDYFGGGICMRESGTGKVFTVTPIVYNSTTAPVAPGTIFIEAGYWASPTSRTSSTTIDLPTTNAPIFVRILRSGSNILAQVSTDNTNWTTFRTVATTTAFTTAPDQAGLCGIEVGTADTVSFDVLSYNSGS
jgi:hypothetical protein